MNSSDQHECSGPSSVSPNLIRPFDVVDDSCVSPNLIDPFKRLNNETFVKVREDMEIDEEILLYNHSRFIISIGSNDLPLIIDLSFIN